MQYDICMSEGGDLIQIVSRRPDRRQDHMEARQDARDPRFVLIKMSNMPTLGLLQKIEQTSIWENEINI